MCPLGGTKSRPIASSFYKFYIVMSHWWYDPIAVVGGSGSWELETCPEMQGLKLHCGRRSRHSTACRASAGDCSLGYLGAWSMCESMESTERSSLLPNLLSLLAQSVHTVALRL